MNPKDILFYGQRTLHESLEGLPESTWDTDGVCGWWSVKNVLSHLVVFELMLEDILNGFVTPGFQHTMLAEVGRNGLENVNTAEVGKRQHTPGADVLREFDAVNARVLALVPQIDVETWRKVGTLPWYGAEYALEDYIVYAAYGHKREHSAQINVFKDSFNPPKRP
jgi:hypothetical protein